MTEIDEFKIGASQTVVSPITVSTWDFFPVDDEVCLGLDTVDSVVLKLSPIGGLDGLTRSCR
jgi:hypothetical protein